MILSYKGIWPEIRDSAFVAPSADIIGDVKIGDQSSIWFQCVIRGDVNSIRIGNRTNIQDQSTLHVTRKKYSLDIGDDVTAGHRVMLHGCKVGNRVLIGMSSTIMDGAEIGDDCVIGAGALVTQGKKIPPGMLAMGSPAKVIRPLTNEEKAYLKTSAANYVADGADYLLSLGKPQRAEDRK